MLDTIKVGIPLTKFQYKRIQETVAKANNWQWVLFNPSMGEMLFRRMSGLATTDQHSYHRELRWDIPYTYSPDSKLTLEFSIPKYYYGHNVHLLYDFVKGLRELKLILDKQFRLKRTTLLPDPLLWHVSRVDCCYAWRFPGANGQKICHQFLDSLKRLHFPRKKPVIYPTAILFKGTTYSLKFYEKYPEFRAHDLKEMVKAETPLEFINLCENKAFGVLRVEATLRNRYLRRHGINTIADLARPMIQMNLDQELVDLGDMARVAIDAIIAYNDDDGMSRVLGERFRDGEYLTMPIGEKIYYSDSQINGGEFACYEHTGGGFSVAKVDNPTTILQSLVAKFVGENPGMQTVDQIELSLAETYKPVKAARLVSFWLYVQKFGSAKARDVFGKRSYYYNRSELKKAGVNLLEPPSGNVITISERDWLQRFRLEIPSPDVTNAFDDGRNIDNIFNFIPRVSGEQCQR